MRTGRPPRPVAERLKRMTRPEGDCLVWIGAVNQGGYAQITVAARALMAHRVAYELVHGQIPDGLELDHLCRRPNCVNPAHLEPVTSRTNILRSTGPAALNVMKATCPRGHLYDIALKNGRWCKKCNAEAQKKYRLRLGPVHRERHRLEEQRRRDRLKANPSATP